MANKPIFIQPFDGTNLATVTASGALNINIVSSGPAGTPMTAPADARPIFIQPFDGTNLATITGGALNVNVVSGGGGGAVTSVFARTGAVVATTGDYAVAQVTGAAPLASPIFTGTATVRQTGGTAGTDEVQAFHDGTNGFFKSASGSTRIISAGTTFTGTNPVELFEAGAAAPGLQLLNDMVTVSQLAQRSQNWLITGSGSFLLGSQGNLLWSTASTVGGPVDVGLGRASAGVAKVTDGSTGFGDLKTRTTFVRKNTVPADAELSNSELALWFDPTPGAAKLMIKAKDSAGTVVTGSLPLA